MENFIYELLQASQKSNSGSCSYGGVVYNFCSYAR